MKSLLGVMLLVAACGHSQPAALVPSTAPQLREVATPQVCLGKRRLLEALGNKELAAEVSKPSTRNEAEPTIRRGATPAIQNAYAIAAPATVLIKTRDGMGSGVVIDAKRGLVLTNHHVVDGLLGEDLTIRVTLELGQRLPAGRVVSAKQTLEGVVVRTDAVKDLAIVKILNPPKDLAETRLAEIDPRVGETVMSIGNAGIGLLWAAKVCNVSKVGDVTRETSMLALGDCERSDATASDSDRRRQREQCQARKDEIKKHVEQSPQALSIQTTCGINGGDSGGPLVNAWGEIVGINQSVRFGANTLAFHVHVAEVRSLLVGLPDQAIAVIPDPYCKSGAEVAAEDFDGDGAIDTTAAAGMAFEGGEMLRQGTYLFDLDGDGVKRVTADRPFDAELALILERDTAFAFYDTDGDGRFDVLLRDAKADGSVERAYRLVDQQARLDETLRSKHTIDAALLGPKSLERLGATVAGLGFHKLATAEIIAAADTPTVPDFKRAFGTEGFSQDADGDGVVETIYSRGDSSGMSMLVDVRSKALAGLKSGDAAAPALKTGEIHPQYGFLDRPAGVWALYDTDGSGSFDLALFAKRPPQLDGNDRFMANASYTTHAFALVPGKPPQPVPAMIGRSVTRTDVFTDATLRRTLEKMMMMNRGNARGSLPDPLEGATGRSEPWRMAALETDRQVLEQTSRLGHVALIDLDRDTRRVGTRSIGELTKPGEFDAEIAIVRDVEAGWIYYDTDRDGAFDTVLYTRNFAEGIADNAFKLDATGEKVSSLPAGGKVFRPELVNATAKQREKLTALVASMTSSMAMMKKKPAE